MLRARDAHLMYLDPTGPVPRGRCLLQKAGRPAKRGGQLHTLPNLWPAQRRVPPTEEPYYSSMRTPMTKTTRQALAEADRKKRRENKNAELDRQDREAAERLHNIKPPPLFSEVAVDGACPKCRGRQFRNDTGGAALGGFLVAGLVGAAIAAAASSTDERIECVTCGEGFRRG
jgi:hypothetical protein